MALLPHDARAGLRWNRLPTEALQRLVGVLGDGSPLRKLLDRLPEATAVEVEKRLVESVTLGYNPTQTAEALRNALGLTESRALTIARTEQLRAYRGASLESYRVNSDVVTGWRRRAARQSNTCIACIILDGKVYGLDEEPDFHPNDRCAVLPVLRHYEYSTDTALDWFKGQPEDTQRQMLGPLAYDAWKKGDLHLPDLVRVSHSDAWGRTATVGSVRRSVEAHAARTSMAEHIRQLGPQDVVTVGQLPTDVVSHWGDATGNEEIVLTGNRRRHYIERHPEVEAYEDRITELLVHPDEVQRNKSQPNIAIFYKRVDARHYLRAAVAMQPVAGRLKHSVLSIRLAYVEEVKRGRERRVWKR